jgi:hypothetical protein
MRRPSLLSLITQSSEEVTTSTVPPLPSQSSSIGGKVRLRASTTIDPTYEYSDQGWRTAYPLGRGTRFHSHRGFTAITESSSGTLVDSPLILPSSSSSGRSETDVTNSNDSSGSSPSSSPPPRLPVAMGFSPAGSRKSNEPYSDGPVEVVPLVFLGAEDSIWDEKWKVGSSSRIQSNRRVRILNVAQEIDDPFSDLDAARKRSSTAQHDSRVRFEEYDQDGYRVEYGHLRWSHGESGLADLGEDSSLSEILGTHTTPEGSNTKWGFWRAITWMEEARREGVPVLIQ